MANGAVSEVGAGSQGGIAPVAVLHGTNATQGKFGSLQDFWSILGTHGVTASADEAVRTKSEPVIESPAGDSSHAKAPAQPMEHSVQTGATPKVPVPSVPGVKSNLLLAQPTAVVGTVSKEGSSGDAKKHSKPTDTEDSVTVPKSSGIADGLVNSPAVVAPAPVETVSGTKAAHEASGTASKRGVTASRIPDGLVSKQNAGTGVAVASDKAQPVGADTASSASGHSGGNGTAMAVTGTGLAVTPAADASTAFAATLAPAMEHLVSNHGVAGQTGAQPERAQGAAATGDPDSVAGYTGVSGFSEPQTMVANSNVLEVGLTGGAHGWLRVRAELGHTGEVTASLVASNAGSAQSLDKQLGAMADYLKTEAVSVGSLTVSASERSAGTDVSSGMSGGAGADAGSSSGSGENARSRQNFVDWTSAANGSNPEEILSGMAQSLASSGSSVPSALLGTEVGGWLNVRV